MAIEAMDERNATMSLGKSILVAGLIGGLIGGL